MQLLKYKWGEKKRIGKLRRILIRRDSGAANCRVVKKQTAAGRVAEARRCPEKPCVRKAVAAPRCSQVHSALSTQQITGASGESSERSPDRRDERTPVPALATATAGESRPGRGPCAVEVYDPVQTQALNT